MFEHLQPYLVHPLARSVLAGVIAAAAIDIAAFRAWKSWDDATRYDWRTASFRWVQGAVIGLLAGLGLAAVA